MSISELMAGGDASAFTRDLLVKIGEATPELIYAKDTNSRMIFANRAVLDTLGKSWEDICRVSKSIFPYMISVLFYLISILCAIMTVFIE